MADDVVKMNMERKQGKEQNWGEEKTHGLTCARTGVFHRTSHNILDTFLGNVSFH
jgi:hypothetical protein